MASKKGEGVIGGLSIYILKVVSPKTRLGPSSKSSLGLLPDLQEFGRQYPQWGDQVKGKVGSGKAIASPHPLPAIIQ